MSMIPVIFAATAYEVVATVSTNIDEMGASVLGFRGSMEDLGRIN